MEGLFRRSAAALAVAMPLAAAAVDYTGTDYEPWSYSAGCVAWRATESLFHSSTVVDVPADGVIVEEDAYTFGTSGHPWQVFASNQTAYSTPGKVLVYDVAGKTAATDAQFAPLSFGGMWVKVLQAEGVPYSITDNKTDGSDRKVELGAAGASTYFKFDESFTFDRNSATKVLGTATVEIANGKTFTINKRAGKGAVVEAGNTLVLNGAGTLAVVGGLSIDGTLDLSAATRPSIDGDVALAGTIVLPANTEVSSESPFTVCTGTLSGLNVLVKIGDAEAVEKSFTAVNGAITAFADPIYVFTENYPTVVPVGQTYTFVGGDSAENTVVVDALDVRGTLKTQGYFSFTNYKSNGSTLDVETGSLTLNPGNNWFNGTLTVEAGATFVNTLTDAVQYGGTFTANIYGTLNMGATRWSLGSNNTLNFHEGCTVTGSGQSGNGTFDWIENATGTLNVDGDVNLAAPIRIRSTATVNFNVDTTDQKGLTLADTIGAGKIVKKGAGLVKFTTNPPYAITVENGAFTFAVDATPTITYSAKPGTGTSMSMWYATQSTWKGTVVIGALSAPTALPLDAYGNANSKIVLAGTSGNCYLNGTTTVAAELVVGTNANNVVEFNNGNSGQVGTFSKVSGPGTLKLVGWSGCSAATYVLSTLDNFDGLAVHNAITRDQGGTFTIRIGNIVTTRSTESGSCVLPIAQTAVDGATGTVVYNLENATVNGNPLDLEAKADGIYVAVPNVTITVPVVANTTIEVSVGGETVDPATEGESSNTYSVAAGATVTVTYTSDGYEVTGGTFEFTAEEGYTVDAAEVTTKQYVSYVVFQQESGQSFVDVTNYYTTVSNAIDAAKAMRKTVVLVAQPEATDTYAVSAGDVVNIKKGEFTFDGIIFPEGSQYNNTTTETAGVTQYKCAVYTATVQYPGGEPVSMTESLIQILGGLYSGYVPAYAGTVVTVLDGSDATVGDAMPEVFTYDSEAHTYTLKTMVASINTGAVDIYYPTISNAFEAVVSGQTIKVLCDNTSNVRSVRVKEGTTVTLDLNGFTVTGPSGDNPMFWLENNSNFVVTDTTEDKAGKLVSEESKVVWSSNPCTLTLTAGTLESTTSVPVYIYFSGVNGSRTVNINGGRLVSDSTSSSALDYCVMNASGTVNMRAGEIVSACGGFGGSTVNVSGGTVTVGTDNAIFRSGSAYITVTGGTFNKTFAEAYLANGYEVVNNGDGTYTVRLDKGWVYEDADFPGHTGSWATPISYDAATGKARIESDNTYTAERPSAGQLVTLTATLSFDAINEVDDDIAGAKAAVRLGAGATEGEYVFQLYTTNGVGGAGWVDVVASGVVPATDVDYTFTFVLDMTNRTYKASVGGVSLAADGGKATFAFAAADATDYVQSVELTGSGSFTSLTGEFTDDVPTGFVADQVIGSVTLTGAQADWLNAQNSYDALATKLATLTQAALNTAYLLNLNILSENYDGTYTFTVTKIEFGKDAQENETVVVTVGLTRNGALEGGINGTLKLKGGTELGTAFDVLDSVTIVDADFSEGDTTTCTFQKGDAPAKFYQAVIE